MKILNTYTKCCRNEINFVVKHLTVFSRNKFIANLKASCRNADTKAAAVESTKTKKWLQKGNNLFVRSSILCRLSQKNISSLSSSLVNGFCSARFFQKLKNDNQLECLERNTGGSCRLFNTEYTNTLFKYTYPRIFPNRFTISTHYTKLGYFFDIII